MARQSALRSTGSTTAWRKIRQTVINRDGCCQKCGTEENLTVDHIVPRVLGGSDAMSNLEVLCQSCNSSKGGRFFESPKTPPTLHGSFYPKNATESHYLLESDEN
ncbi:HNHc domain containing protein [uncultured Caudovirales phage]|uniref:HNHc domain containing protein n=1 Tax=uncultured Caudovirales phage TaxID=2100421 RepID=A0A6J5M7U0_9CAUD|nr:HNHc domain containing protein [uncultured Caudovirales phage]